MCLPTWRHQGPLNTSSCATFTLKPHQGRAATSKKEVLCLCTQGCFSHVQLFVTLWTEAYRFLCQDGSPGKNTGVYWPILVAIPI